MSRLNILPYNNGSESAIALQTALNNLDPISRVLRIRPDGEYRERPDDVILNWGRSTAAPVVTGIASVINAHTAVSTAVNKLTALEVLSENDIRTPEFTDDEDVARSWLEYGGVVFCRTELSSHGGNGIELATHPDDIVDAPLYTRGIVDKEEYRVWVFATADGAEVIRYAKRITAEGHEIDEDPIAYDNMVRNLGDEWIFATNIAPRDSIKQLAIAAVRALGLNFGAVDIILNLNNDTSYVLEVNTAPGFEDGSDTAQVIAESIKRQYPQCFRNGGAAVVEADSAEVATATPMTRRQREERVRALMAEIISLSNVDNDINFDDNDINF